MFYFVNFENNGGYAIVSTDRRAGDVIAFSRSGNINPDSIDYDMSLQDYYYYNTYSYRIYAHCNWGFGETAPEYCISSLIQPTGKLALYDFYHFYITM